MAPSHPVAKTKTIAVEDMVGQPWVVMNRRRNYEHRRTIFRVFATQRPNIATETGSVNSLVTEVTVGKCVGLVSQLFKGGGVNRLTYRALVNTDVAMRVGIARAKMTACPQRRKLCTRTERSLKHGGVVTRSSRYP